MKPSLTFLLLLFFFSSYAQSSEPNSFEEVTTQQSTLLTPDFLDYRRVARTKFRNYSQTTMDSIAYFYPNDTSKFYTSSKYYALEDGIYNNVRIDSAFFDGDEWILVKQYDWNEDLSIFEYDRRSHKFVEGDSTRFLTEKYLFDSDEWVNSRLTIQIKFPSGVVKKKAYYAWNTDWEDWELSFSVKYNELGKQLEFKSKYSWDVDAWDSLGYPISKLTKYFIGSDYVNSDSTSYQWLNDTFQLGLDYKWDADLNEWGYTGKIELNYDSEGLLNKELRLDSVGINQYQNRYNRILSYDEKDREVSAISQNWDGSFWVFSVKRTADYDMQDHLVLWNSSSWVVDSSAWELKSENRYYYEAFENGLVRIQDLEKVLTKVYPNPTSAFITFEVESVRSNFDVTIYSTLGRKMLSQKSAKEANIDVSQLPSGQYFYILEGKDFGATGVFVKE